MSRIAPVPADSSQIQGLAPLAARGANGSRALGTVLRNQPLYAAWRPFARYLNSSTCVSRRDRELLILRTAWLMNSDYEWGNHVLAAKDAGIADQEIDAIREGSQSPVWSPQEATLLRMAEELVGQAWLPDEVFGQLSSFYSEEQIIESVMLVGHYVMMAYLFNSVGIEREDGVPGFEYPTAAGSS
jgi:4-carboxymuconolactone decarboxylase